MQESTKAECQPYGRRIRIVKAATHPDNDPCLECDVVLLIAPWDVRVLYSNVFVMGCFLSILVNGLVHTMFSDSLFRRACHGFGHIEYDHALGLDK